MTISTTTTDFIYTGNNSATEFAEGPFAFVRSQVEVILRDTVTNTDTLLTHGVHYQISNLGEVDGVTVTYPLSGSPLSSTQKLIVYRAMNFLQPTQVLNQGGFNASSIEDQFDRVVMMLQEHRTLLMRTPRWKHFSTVADVLLPEPSASSYLRWNPAGTGLMNGPQSAVLLNGNSDPYENVASMLASTTNMIGYHVKVAGYERPGDGGDAVYKIVAAGTYTANPYGGVFDLTGIAGQAVLADGPYIKGECFGIVLDANGQAQERSANFNAWIKYLDSLDDTYKADDGETLTELLTGGYRGVLNTDFTAKDMLALTGESDTNVSNLWLYLNCKIIAVAGGTLETHTHTRPIPLIHFKGRNCKIGWPKLECEMLCAGIKAKVDLGNTHWNLEMRGFHRYGLWLTAANDSTWWDPIIKQFYRDPDWIRNGVNTDDWDEWNGDCVVITTKDRRIIGGQIGWSGPCVRITDTMPSNAAERIPGRNCYWCGLSASSNYIDGDNGGGDFIWDNPHFMQPVNASGWSGGPRYGAFADYDMMSGDMIIRQVDTPIGILSFCKVSNLTYFDRLDNDGCNHYLFGAQVEITNEANGSTVNVSSVSTSPNHILDPRIRVFASRGGAGGARFPFMASMARSRQMTLTFENDYWTHQTAFTAGGLVDGHAFLANHQAAIEALADIQQNVRYIPATGLADVGDGVHFTGASLVTLGEGHADQIIRQLMRNPSTAPVCLLSKGQSNSVGHVAAKNGDHTIQPGVYVWNGTLNDGAGTAFIPAEYGVAPFNRGTDPWANNIALSAANEIKLATGRDVYIIVMAKGGRNAECWVPPAVNTANGWTADEDFTAFIEAELIKALPLIPGRKLIAPDALLWQQGEANSGDTVTVYRNKLKAMLNWLVGLSYFNPSISWLGDHSKWNVANRASGNYTGSVQDRGRLTAGVYTPTVYAAGDRWLAQGAVTVNPGGVTAVDGQLIYALTDTPAGAGDWLVVDADSAPVRSGARWELNVKPTVYNYYPADDEDGIAQINDESPGDKLTRKMQVAGATMTETLNGESDIVQIDTSNYRFKSGLVIGTNKSNLAKLVDPPVTPLDSSAIHPDVRQTVSPWLEGNGNPLYRIQDLEDISVTGRFVQSAAGGFPFAVRGPLNFFTAFAGSIDTDGFGMTIKPSLALDGWAENGVVYGWRIQGIAATAATGISFDGDSRNIVAALNVVRHLLRTGNKAHAYAIAGLAGTDTPNADSENIVLLGNVADDIVGNLYHIEDAVPRIVTAFGVARRIEKGIEIINDAGSLLQLHIGNMIAGPSVSAIDAVGTGNMKDSVFAFNFLDGAGVASSDNYAFSLGQVGTKNILLFGNVYHETTNPLGAFWSNAAGPLNLLGETFDGVTGICMKLDRNLMVATIGYCMFNGGTYGISATANAKAALTDQRSIYVQSTNTFEGVATAVVDKANSSGLIGDQRANGTVIGNTASDEVLFIAQRAGWITGVQIGYLSAAAGATSGTFNLIKSNTGGSTTLLSKAVSHSVAQYGGTQYSSEHADLTNSFARGDIIRLTCNGGGDSARKALVQLDFFYYDNGS